MKKALLIIAILFSFVLENAAQTDQYTVRARYKLQADKDFVIGANNDTIRFTTQLNSTDDTIVTLQYLDSLFMEDRAYTYESEILTDGQTTVALPWDLKTTSEIIYNDSGQLRLSEWSGVGTTTLNLLFGTKKYEYLIIRR